ncbi:MAG: tetratricopeptide repeat protein [Armatimonadota bacterium]
MITCPRCGKENPPEAQFCMRCGTALFRACPNCKTNNPLDAQFCLRCGTPLGEAVQVERRVLSVLFADLVASTPLAARLDPEETRVIQGEYFGAMREEVVRHGGVVEKFIGDAVMSVFGLPVAHEDDPERAVRAAVAMQGRMPALNARLHADLHIRIGISTGEVIADPRAVAAGEFMVTGDVVNLAARFQQQAPPDGIVVDERTRGTTRHRVDYRPLPPAGDGDFEGRPRWQVAGLAEASASGRRLRASLVGREDELRFLLALYRRVVEGRKPHLATILGAAGVGKTRLVDDVLERLWEGQSPPQVLRGRCPAYGEGLTYRPLAEMLRDECGIKDSDPSDVMSEKLRAQISAVCEPALGALESERIVADLAPLLGVTIPARSSSGAHDRRSAADALLLSLHAFLMAKAQRGPLLLAFEDLHWAEESLLELLTHLAMRGGDGPILILCLARPEMLEQHPDWGAGIRNYTAVSLAPLDHGISRRLIAELLKHRAAPANIYDVILAKAEGNPFFIQEILHMLVETGALASEGDGWRWTAPPLEIRIPDTIHGILASRLDLLSALEKRAIQDASIAGRVFWLGSLVATSELTAAEAAAALRRLQERDLVEERATSSVAEEREFAFTHALIREVAYASVPKAARSERHIRFADWLSRTVGGREGEFLAALAAHREHAWRYRVETGDRAPVLARSAIAALRQAGARAAALRTFPEARRMFDRSLSIVKNAGLVDDTALLLEVLTERTEVVKWMSLPDLIFKDTDTVLRLAPTIGRDDLLARAWLNRAIAEWDRARLQPAEEALHRALELFGKLNDRHGQAEALEVLASITDELRGKLSRAQDAYMQAQDLYRELGDGQGMARTMAWRGHSLLNSGNLTEARALFTLAAQTAKTHHERISEASSVLGLAKLAHLAGDSEEAVRLYHEAIALRQALGDPMMEANVRRNLGMHHLRWGRLDEAEQEFQTARALRWEHGAKFENTMLLRGLAEVSLARGDVLAAAEYAEQALAGLADQDEISRETVAATLGKVRAAQGRADDAEALFRESIEILERKEYRIDLATTLLKYGEALLLLNQPERARPVLARARDLFAGIGAAHLVRETEARLASAGGVAQPAV